MKEIAISEFKAKCLSIVDQVHKTKRPIRITKRGKPVAEVIPPTPESVKEIFGFMKGKMEILGNIVSPAGGPDDGLTLATADSKLLGLGEIATLANPSTLSLPDLSSIQFFRYIDFPSSSTKIGSSSLNGPSRNGGVTASTEMLAARRHAGVHTPVIACKMIIANQQMAYAA